MAQRHKRMKKTLKWVGIVILTPILLIIILALLLYFPPVQNWAVKHVAAYASESSGMDISIGHVNLEFPLDLGLDDVKIIQQNDSLPQVKDTVADIHKTVVDVQLWPLLKSQVMVDELDFRKMKVNTTNFIPQARIKGNIGELAVKAHGIDLKKEYIKVNNILLSDAKVSIELSDTVPPDTTPSTNFWKLQLDNLNIKKTDFTLHMPGDTLMINTFFEDAVAKDGYMDFFKGLYQVQHLDWQGGHAKYDNNFATHSKGFDANHLFLDSLTLKADSFYFCKSDIKIDIQHGNFLEQGSKLKVDTLSGPFAMDSTRMYLPDLYLKTPWSALNANFVMDMNTFADKDPGKMLATIHGYLGKPDLMVFMAAAPSAFTKRWPNQPLRIDGSLKGNMTYIYLTDLSMRLPSAFNIWADGWASHFMNPDKLQFNVDVNAHTYNLNFVTAMLDPSLMKQIRVPSGITVKGNFKGKGSKYQADFLAKEGRGSMKAKANVDISNMVYDARLTADNLQIQHFVPNMGLHSFTGYVKVDGMGTDFLSPKTRLNADAKIQKFGIDGYNLDHVNAIAHVANGKVKADIDSRNALLKGFVTLEALVSKKQVKATMTTDLNKIDFYHLHLLDQPLAAAFCGHIDLDTDMKDYYKVQGMLSDMTFMDKDSVYRPDDVVLDVLTRRDTTHAVVDCGDFHLNMNAATGYKKLMSSGNGFVAELQKQIKNKIIDQVALRRELPDIKLYLQTGRYNFISSMLRQYGYDFKVANIDMSSSPIAGLNGVMSLDSLVLIKDSMRIDTIRLKFDSSAKQMAYSGYVKNNLENTPTFTAKFKGEIHEKGTSLSADVFDKDDKLGLSLPLRASMENEGIKLSLHGGNLILGYKEFSYNQGNYVLLKDDGRLFADMKLKADDGQGIQLYSDNDNLEALQDLTLNLNKFDLEKLMSVIPYAPNVSGVMNGDFHVIQTKTDLSVSSDIAVDRLTYEHCPMGNIETQFVYVPKSDGSHQVDGILLSDDREVGTIQGTYRSEGSGYLDATLTMDKLPMQIVNGFIPDRLFGLNGTGEGKMTIQGPLSKPDVNGEVYLDSTYFFSEPYGVKMRFANDPVRIKNSKLLFENFEMYANNDSPLNISGNFDFSDLDKMMLDIRMRAQNFKLIDAKENPRSEAYGKAFVNFMGVMRGPVNALKMRGRLDILGTTDMTYVMKESQLTTDNELEELVKFTDFTDSTSNQFVKRPDIQGFDMTMNISVDEGAHIVCALNAEHTNYIDLMGGGNLRMSYNNNTKLQLTGRYTLNSGEMKYSLPIIPLKTFHIKDGSYIEFTGDAFDPTLHITATESIKATTGEGTANGQVVDFDCGVKLSQTLNKMGIEFIISAPENMVIQDELNSMTTEDRSKIAITMLASGMYLTNGNTSSFSMNSALASFLNSEINNIAGNAMRTLGLDLGMTVDNSTNASGALHTDYNFKFAKRFFNNRVSFILGGKVSSGADLDENNNSNSVFNNAEVQYRLNKNASQYIRGFYNNSVYDWLSEAVIGEYGIGFKWTRKLQHFNEIFKFKTEPEPVPTAPANSRDTTVVKAKREN